MDDHLDICTLGGLAVLRGGTPIDRFDQRKVPALLVYLACTDRPQPREVLAELFWEDRSQSQSLANLRVALSNLRKTVGPFVTIDRETAGMAHTGSWRLDAVTFEDRLNAAGDDVQPLDEAVALYQGDFLEGFYVDSQGFEDWALLERERLRFRIVDALDRLIDGHIARRDYASGIAQAARLLHVDPLREKTHRQLMQLQALSGEREAALAQFETCRRMLKTEFGVQPTAETVALVEHIRAGAPLAVPAGPAATPEPETLPDVVWPRPRHNLPVQSTSFVGREHDIAAIVAHATHPDCRLLTLVGPGGMGKTRLGLAVAERLIDAFEHGVFFVPLAPLTSQESIAATVIGALPWQPRADSKLSEVQPGYDTDEHQLLNILRDKRLLLVMDNFEHVLDGAGLVDRILAAAPGVAVLVTSREPLTPGWEWLYEVRGMLHPASNAADSLDDHSAIRLFVERARRVQPGFRLADERASVMRICQLVEGMPLGIEIAAAWLRLMPCDAIAAELLDLENPQRDIPDRHRSLRDLFDHTWQHLTAQEQHTFMSLSVFRGGFTREAAEEVAQTTVPRLAALVNKSLLHCDRVTGRFSIHELLRQDMAGRMNARPAMQNDVFGRHAAYYADFLRQLEAQVRGMGEPPQTVLTERANLRAAWDWAVAQHDLDVIRRAMQPLFWLHLWLEEQAAGRVVFGQAVAALTAGMASSAERDRAVGQLLAMQSELTFAPHLRRDLAERGLAFLRRAGNPDELAFAQRLCWRAFGSEHVLAWEMLDASLATYTGLGDTWRIAWCLLGISQYCKDITLDYRAATRYAQEAAALFDRCGDDRWYGDTLMLLGNIATTSMEFDQAWQYFQEGLALFRKLVSPRMTSNALNNMAYAALYRGEWQEAERLAGEAVAIKRALGYPVDLNGVLDTLGDIKGAHGDFLAAKAIFEECYAIVDQHVAVSPYAVAYSHKQLGWTYSGLGETGKARQHFVAALRLVGEARDSSLTVCILLDVASLLAREHEPQRALMLLGVTLTHPAANVHLQDQARLRDDLQAEFGPEAVAAAIERGRDRDLFEVAREALAVLEHG